MVPNEQKFGIFSEIRNLVVKTSPTIQNEQSWCVILWGCSKIQKTRRLRQTRRQKTEHQRKKQALPLQFAAGILFLLDNYLKEEKYV